MRAFATILTALWAGMAHAGDGLQRLGSLDLAKSWQSVGRINIGPTGFCTGTLISPDLVLTAAHCLFDASGRRADTSDIEFLAGWQNGRASAYRKVRRTVLHPSYETGQSQNADKVASDLALIELDHPIRNASIKPIATGALVASGAKVGVISYAKGREGAPSLQDSCDVLAQEPGVYVTSCDVDFGASGAPVFAIKDGAPVIVSVVSAKAEWRAQSVALSAGTGTGLAPLLDQIDRLDGVFRRVELTSGVQGATFLKP